MGHSKAFYLLACIASIGPIGIQTYLASYAAMAESFQLSPSEYQWVLSASVIISVFAIFCYGPLSDRFGRKPLLIAGLTLFFLGSLIIAIANSFWLVGVGRMIQVCGTSCGYLLARAIAKDLYDENVLTKVLGLLGMSLMFVPLSLPYLFGLALINTSWNIMFFILSGIIFVFILMIFFLMKETLKQKIVLTSGFTAIHWPSIWALKYNSKFLAFTFSNSLALSIYFAFLMGAPHILHISFQGELTDYGESYFIIGLGYIFGSYLAALLSKYYADQYLILVGAILATFSSSVLVGIAWLASLNQMTFTALYFFISLGISLSLPASYSSAAKYGSSNVGTSTSVNLTIEAIFCSAVTLLIGFVDYDNPIFYTIIVFILALSFLTNSVFILVKFKDYGKFMKLSDTSEN